MRKSNVFLVLSVVLGVVVGYTIAMIWFNHGSRSTKSPLSSERPVVNETSVANLVPTGWKIAVINGVPQDVAPSLFDVGKLKLCPPFAGGGSGITGEEVRRLAVEWKGNFGLADGKRMLAEQDDIRREIRDFYIVLPGTVLLDLTGDLRIPYLSFRDRRGALYFGRLNDGWWYGLHRLVCN